MSDKEHGVEICVIAGLIMLFLLVVGYYSSPLIRAAVNEKRAAVQQADDATRYETRRKVEDTCRAMIASYEADRLMWKQYNGSESAERQGWADQAMMRANRTAATYNEYVLKNSYVWEGNVPKDIRERLEMLEVEKDG